MHVSFYPVDLPLMPVMKWVSGAHIQLKPPFFDACDVTTLLGSSQCVRKLEDSSLLHSLPPCFSLRRQQGVASLSTDVFVVALLRPSKEILKCTLLES